MYNDLDKTNGVILHINIREANHVTSLRTKQVVSLSVKSRRLPMSIIGADAELASENHPQFGEVSTGCSIKIVFSVDNIRQTFFTH